MKNSRRRNCRGGSVLEMAFMMPWLAFLFVGAFDWGFYAHALISTENAVRVAAIYASQNTGTATDIISACRFATDELSVAGNVTSGVCGSGTSVTVTATSLTGSASPDGTSPASMVSVQYTTVQVIPIPGLLEGKATIYRTATMRLRG